MVGTGDKRQQVPEADTLDTMGAVATHRFAVPRRRWWRKPAPWLLLAVPVMLVASRQVAGMADDHSDYVVSVPVTLRPHDPALWSMVNAADFTAARAIDPSLPDPNALAIDPAAVLPAPDPTQLRLESYAGRPARRYIFRGASATDTARAHYCLTAALYYEAASESDDGMRGVAQVVLNRVRHPSFPASICGVVFQGSQRAGVCQFTFACDGSMARAPERRNWSRASRIAAEALAGRVFAPVGVATHYHTLAVWPSWGRSLAMTNVIGAHIFHRWRGRWGEPDAFLRPYSGRETTPGPYLPIAQQLAARRGVPVADPALAAAGTVDPATLAAIAAAAPVGAPGAVSPLATAGDQPGATATAAPAPTYTDPRLAGSGTVREEYRNSGTAITR